MKLHASWPAAPAETPDILFHENDPSPTATTSAVAGAAAIPIGTGIGTLNVAAARNMSAITSVISDKLVANQWHLGFLGDLATVWRESTGKDVSFGVYDSGVDTRLSAFKGNYDASKEVRIDGKLYKGDYRPASGEHGTAVAGLIAAKADGIDTVGVAYGAKLTSVNIFDPFSGGGRDPGIFVNAPDSTKFYKAMAAGNQFDVTNHSWGSAFFSHGLNGNRLYEGSGAQNTVAAVAFAADTGRGGLGTIALKAAGNGGANSGGDYLRQPIDVAADSVATDRHWTLVGAFREIDGNASSYSFRGAGLLISAPSNDIPSVGGTGIWTTDVKGREGYNTSYDPGGALNYTDSFGGTSAATPIASGVVGLMLDANPDLGWRDVKNIVAASALMPVTYATGPTTLQIGFGTVSFNEDRFKLTGDGAASTVNGGGYHFSTDYGYGAINAFGATRMAEVWNLFGDAQASANEQHVQGVGKFNKVLADATYDSNYNIVAGKAQTFSVTIKQAIDLEHIDLTIAYADTNERYSRTEDLAITLISPDGTRYASSTYSNLFDLFGEGGTIGKEVIGLAGFRGESSLGTWKIMVSDLSEGKQVIVKGITLDAYGSAPTTNNVHHYTDELATMLAIKGEADRKIVTDTNGGTDWFDFSATATSVSLDMSAGGSIRYSGTPMMTVAAGTLIENAVMGDGFDSVYGNAADNHILGMRGSDYLDGGAGNDFIVGGAGFDDLYGGAGQDVFYFDTKQRVDQDRIYDFDAFDLLATTERFDTNGVIALTALQGNGVLRFDNIQFGERVTFDNLANAKLYLVAQDDGVFYYSLSRTAKVTNAIALGDGPLDATPSYRADTHQTPTVSADGYKPIAPPTSLPNSMGFATADLPQATPDFDVLAHGAWRGVASLADFHYL